MIRIIEEKDLDLTELTAPRGCSADVAVVVSQILQDVKANGDAALTALTERFDHVHLDRFDVTVQEMEDGLRTVEPGFFEILKEAAENISSYHAKQIRNNYVISKKEGIILGKVFRPIQKVGMYVPNGTAAYPSTVLMDLIPAKLAGCEEIVMVSPPDKEGKIDPYILAAARICGIEKIYKVGGAQAIGALAYGTETIPAVYKIIGPGNAYVAEAKKQIHGIASTDTVAGPSEVLVIADDKNSAAVIAADMLAQAEHDVDASAMMITDSLQFARKVSAEIEIQLSTLPRRDIAAKSIEKNGKIIVVESVDDAFRIANTVAPEHLEISLDDPMQYLPLVRNAGSVFLGRFSPEPLGDYMAGPNHTLPTGGSARFSSALSVDDFMTASQFTCYSEQALGSIADKIVQFARIEGLEGHARSILSRFQ